MDNNERIQRHIQDFINQNGNVLRNYYENNNNSSNLMLIFQAFHQSSLAEENFESMIELCMRKTRRIIEETERYNELIDNNQGWELFNHNIDKFIRTLRVYIAFSLFDSIPLNINNELIDSVYNQVNLLNNNQVQQQY
tara:strand:- start:1192 stop:1605 length:414 start_codon:yes stop_codon:yes gene_type:complete